MGNEPSQLSAPSESEGRPQASPLVPVTIKWPHGARSACVCGTFNDWKQSAMQPAPTEQGTWVKVLELKPGVHQYKFIIDGQWKHDPSAPTVLDALGNINNYTTVRAHHAKAKAAVQAAPGATQSKQQATEDEQTALENSASGESFRRERQSSDPYMNEEQKRMRFTQVVPPREDLLVQHAASMMLPPHLLLNLPHLAGDGDKPPIHVQLNHVFVHGVVTAGGGAESPDEEVVVFGMSVRFRDMFVTNVLYKPRAARALNMEPVRAALEGIGGDCAAAAVAASRTESKLGPRQILFLSVHIPETTTKHDDRAGRDYVAYEVETLISVRGAQMALRSSRRYTHFRLLDQMLRRESGSRGSYTMGRLLPPKRTFGNLDAGFVQERRAALEKYLVACIESEAISNSPAFCHFIDSGKGEDGYGIARTDSNILLERISTKQGYLLKQSSRKVSWKSRYFCLYDTELLYYYSEAVSNPFQPLNIVHVAGASVRRVSLASMARHFLFNVRTSQHDWWIAADSESTRDEWLDALCNAGATLTATNAELCDGGSVVGGSFADSVDLAVTTCSIQPTLQTSSQTAVMTAVATAASGRATPDLRPAHSTESSTSGNGSSMRGTGSSETSTAPMSLNASAASGVDGPAYGGIGGACAAAPVVGLGAPAHLQQGLRGTLWKRPSKVHVLHDLESEPAWVTRHFQLIPTEKLLVYVQDSADPIDDPQGILPLSNFGSVEEVSIEDSDRYAFRLCPPAGTRSDQDGERAHLPDDSPRAGPAPGAGEDSDGGREHAASEAFVLLAESAEKRREWVKQIRMLLPDRMSTST